MDMVINRPQFKKPYSEKRKGEYVYHVYLSMEDALMHEQDYAYAGWMLTGWYDNPSKDNAWCKKIVLPKAGGSGWVR
jgi:hypothetical protein